MAPIITAFLIYVVATPYLAPSIAPQFMNSIVDADNDGLFNEQEKQIGTNPLIADTDNDGLNDGLEVKGWVVQIDGLIGRQVTSNPLSKDSDADNLSDKEEWTHLTDPRRSDTDADGLPDRWEVDYGFAPANSHDGSLDPDYDGLTNRQEYQLGTITKNGVLSYDKDLFVEVDYMVGYKPSTEALNWLVTYYGHDLNIVVHVTVDDEVSNSQLSEIGVSPEILTTSECYMVEGRFHDDPGTHVYVFYARAVGDPNEDQPLGWAMEFGAFINKKLVNENEGIKVLWFTNRLKTEQVVLLHEIGHTIGILKTTSKGAENYCSNLGCIMAGADRWWDIAGGIAQMVVLADNTPKYCSTHKALINLTDKWSVDESWKP